MDLPNAKDELLASLGVALVAAKVNEKLERDGLGCQFRATASSDYGIDGSIELLSSDDPKRVIATGRIVSVQVKTGQSFLKPAEGDDWVVYISKGTVNYWMNHSVPVLLFVVDEDKSIIYWVRADSNWEETDKYRKVLVPKANILGADSREAIEEIAKNHSKADAKLARLEHEYPFIQWLKCANDFYLEVSRFEADGKVLTGVDLLAKVEAGDLGSRSWVLIPDDLPPASAVVMAFPYLDHTATASISLEPVKSHSLWKEAEQAMLGYYGIAPGSTLMTVAAGSLEGIGLSQVGEGYLAIRAFLLSE